MLFANEQADSSFLNLSDFESVLKTTYPATCVTVLPGISVMLDRLEGDVSFNRIRCIKVFTDTWGALKHYGHTAGLL